MIDYETASETKNKFAEELFADHPSIVLISPRTMRDEKGNLTGEGYIAVGVDPKKRDEPLKPIPKTLRAYNGEKFLDGEFVRVVVEEVERASADLLNTRVRPTTGGHSIASVNKAPGSMGGVARIGSQWGFILSNNHVIADCNDSNLGSSIYQPIGNNQIDVIGNLHSFIEINFTGGVNEADCALCQVLAPWQTYASRFVYGIGIPVSQRDAVVNEAIRKTGYRTETTCGYVLSDNASVDVLMCANKTAKFENILEYSLMTASGDSGSLIWAKDSLSVLGLHFASNAYYSYGNKITSVLNLLSAKLNDEVSLVPQI